MASNPRSIPRAFFLAAFGVGLALAGCVGEERTLSTSEAPEGPDSLRVGSSGDGEYARFVTNVTGHQLVYDRDLRGLRVEPLDETSYEERRVQTGAQEVDAFLRVRPVVVFGLKFIDPTPPEGSNGIDEFEFGVDQVTHKTLYHTVNTTVQYQSVECNPLGGCVRESQNVTIDGRVYPRTEIEANWASLEGQVLHLGRTLSFNRTTTFGESTYRIYVNYTALREETVGGVRAFVVEPQYDFVQETGPRPRAPSESPEETESKLPKNTHYLWVTAEHSVPVRERWTYWFEHNDEQYYTRGTVDLELYTPPTAPVRWGEGEAAPPLARMPGVELGTTGDFLKEEPGLTYPLGAAWAAVRDDVTLTDFQAYLDAHPAAMPVWGRYSPDPDHQAYGWEFFVADPEAEDTFWVETRRQLVAGLPSQVFVPQNKEVASFRSFFRAPDPDEARLASLSAGLDLYRRLRNPTEEPAVDFQVWRTQFGGSWRPTATFYGKSLDGDTPPLSRHQAWWSVAPVSTLLTDGGLWGDNATIRRGADEWPAFPGLPGPAPVPPRCAFGEDAWAPLSPWHGLRGRPEILIESARDCLA